ncbi:Acylamino-acid-releasing enzyme [Hondaea fermentalgiana]|uniref:acylaminoacyl-peptidase n=1 Tax=Hondaea fermentalgiana TaxID=2315210 RepID=A0A2R5GCF8_9STRA|nr:Acylamino-acid-releasing enzyme [Hondaea fermentalgiana]|eukprot:GBG25434.1 Acylamino-acid-releasing enzyme [Hondaea fermentalgiana]
MAARRARVAAGLQALREGAGPGIAGGDIDPLPGSVDGAPCVVTLRLSQVDPVRMQDVGSRERYLVPSEALAPGASQTKAIRLDTVPEDARSGGSLVLESRFQDSAEADPKVSPRSIRVRKGAKDDKELWLELWAPGHGLVKAVKLSEVASKVYNDAVFGGIRWSPDGNKVVFVGEEAKPKGYANAFAPDNKEGTKETNTEDETAANKVKEDKPFWEAKYEYEDSFGETLEGKTRASIFLWDFEGSDPVQKIESIPENLVPTDPQFAGDGLIFSGVETPVRKLGLNFCLNRTTRLYFLPLDALKAKGDDKGKGACTCLTPHLALAYAAQYARCSGQLVFFGREDEFVSHTTCFELYAATLSGSALENLRVVVNRKRERPEPGTKGAFAGIYGYHGSLRAANFLFARDPSSRWFLMQSPSQGQNLVFLVDLDATDEVTALEISCDESSESLNEGEYELIKIRDACALIRFTSTTHPGKMLLLRFTDREKPSCGIVAITLYDRLDGNKPHLKVSRSIADKEAPCDWLFTRASLHEHRVSIASGAEGYLAYMKDASSTGSKGDLPCVVIIHGGPFSASPRDAFSLLKSFLFQQGVAVFVLNYRGSVGFGEDLLNALVGEIGVADVDDCGQLVQRALEEHANVLDPKRVAVYGGSHGGFLTGWLAGHPQYKDLFCAAALWNPVLNLNYNLVATDIPDWVLGSAEGKPLEHVVTAERTQLLFERSPVSVAANVSIPCLTLLGSSDLRVPPHQGVYFHYSLRERGVPSKLYMFPDSGHAIAPTEQNLNAVFELLLFLHEHLLPLSSLSSSSS